MKDLLEFCAGSPFLAFFLAIIAGCTLISLVEVLTFRPLNRWMRSKNIRAQGWPPPHCDADGDFKPETEKEDES